MSLRIEIECYCQVRCMCQTIPGTKVTKEEIAYNLVRCNPALARYFSKNTTIAEAVIQRKQQQKQNPSPYKSIVQQKNLNILLSDKHPKPVSPKKDTIQIQIPNYTDDFSQTSPINFPQPSKPKEKHQKNPTQQQLRNYYRQLRQTSRYLSDTAFRKYFNRQVFENYGRQNTKGINDGIIYGNYMKTHNINPHTGDNRPMDEETFYHALVSASPDKFLSPDQARRKLSKEPHSRTLSLSRMNENESLEKPLKKHENKEDLIVMDNIVQHQKMKNLREKTYSPKAGNSCQITRITPEKISAKIKKPSPAKKSKSPQPQQPKSPTIQASYVNQKQFIQPVRPNTAKQPNIINPRSNITNKDNNDLLKIQSRKVEGFTQQVQPNDQKKVTPRQPSKQELEKCPVDRVKQSHMEHILSQECNVVKTPKNQVSSNRKNLHSKSPHEQLKLSFSPGSHQKCSCSQPRSGQCKCCLDKVKRQLKEKAQKDVGLNNRLITSAKKATLYKNYALNNAQNSKLNPHNYRNCCGQLYKD